MQFRSVDNGFIGHQVFVNESHNLLNPVMSQISSFSSKTSCVPCFGCSCSARWLAKKISGISRSGEYLRLVVAHSRSFSDCESAPPFHLWVSFSAIAKLQLGHTPWAKSGHAFPNYAPTLSDNLRFQLAIFVTSLANSSTDSNGSRWRSVCGTRLDRETISTPTRRSCSS